MDDIEQEDKALLKMSNSKKKKLGVIREEEEDEYAKKMRKKDPNWEDPRKIVVSNPKVRGMDFNEHEISGLFDKDEKGNIILLTNEKGELVDKKGRKVNEKGYLIDQYGNIVHTKDKKKRIFGEKQLDEKGEIPLPFSYDRYNFNGHDVKAMIDYKKDGVTPILKKKNR